MFHMPCLHNISTICNSFTSFSSELITMVWYMVDKLIKMQSVLVVHVWNS